MNPSLLIVEDDHDQLDALTRWFVRAGYEVVGVSHPRQALEAASFRQFQVALLDAHLPEIDGLELLRRLKQTQECVQVVVMSGDEDLAERANHEGACACLTKPFGLAQLETTVEDALERATDEKPAPKQPVLTKRFLAAATS